VDKEQSYGWLKFEEVLREVESTVKATEVEAIVKNIVKIKFWIVTGGAAGIPLPPLVTATVATTSSGTWAACKGESVTNIATNRINATTNGNGYCYHRWSLLALGRAESAWV
jgi:hypothetical protein